MDAIRVNIVVDGSKIADFTTYWYIGEDGCVCVKHASWQNTALDSSRLECGNYFETEEAAKNELEKRKEKVRVNAIFKFSMQEWKAYSEKYRNGKHQ
jgi:hypothetical protein